MKDESGGEVTDEPMDYSPIFRHAADQRDRYEAALREIVNVLGPGPCQHIQCEGCAYEFAEAAAIANEALGNFTEIVQGSGSFATGTTIVVSNAPEHAKRRIDHAD